LRVEKGGSKLLEEVPDIPSRGMTIANMQLIRRDSHTFHGGRVAGNDQIVFAKVEGFDCGRIEGEQFSAVRTSVGDFLQPRCLDLSSSQAGRQGILVIKQRENVCVRIHFRESIDHALAAAVNKEPVVDNCNSHGLADLH